MFDSLINPEIRNVPIPETENLNVDHRTLTAYLKPETGAVPALRPTIG